MAPLNLLFALILLTSKQCTPRGLPEEDSVVSVYTTPTTAGVTHVDVYHQIANNIAERITSPIYRFLGINRNKTETTTKKSTWEKIEILDELDEPTKAISPMNNEISEKDVEELSAEAIRKIDKKPEKITLFKSYSKENSTINDDMDEVDGDSFDLDDIDDDNSDSDDDKPQAKQGPLIVILEVLGSVIQLIYGGIVGLFSSNKPSQN